MNYSNRLQLVFPRDRDSSPVPVRCLVNALDALPEGTAVHGFYTEFWANTSVMVVSHPSFPATPEGTEFPKVHWQRDGENYYLTDPEVFG